jgi:8-oxo-dGTP diphosphatase
MTVTDLKSEPKSFTYLYERPALTVDAIVITEESRPHVLLIRRKNEPWAGFWALPGGYVDRGETLVAATARELLEETGVDAERWGLKFEQICTMGDPGRDPRGWIVGLAYAALTTINRDQLGARAGDDAAAAEWFPINDLPLPLATDHLEMLQRSFQCLALTDEGVQKNSVLRKALLEAASDAKILN